MICKACQERGKTWHGDDPVCAFPGGVFWSENWNCATMNNLREIAEDHGSYEWLEDMKISLIRINNNERIGWIALSWYKSRGRTGTANFITDSSINPLTLEIAEECLRDYHHKPKGLALHNLKTVL